MAHAQLSPSMTMSLVIAAIVLAWGPVAGVTAQGQPATPPAGPRAAAPIDLAGYWESVIVDDFRFRVTPQKGDIEYLPLTAQAQRAADLWDPERDLADGHQCRAYGAVGVMQQPGRLHISWQDDTTLKIETDAGTQTRLLHFGAKPSVMPKPSLQGVSAARWVMAGGGRGRGAAPGSRSGELEVITTNMLPGYLRKNGVPYSADAVYTEHFHRLMGPNQQPYLTITTSVSDPANLTQPFVYAYHFRQLPDAKKWAPTPCWNK